MPSYRVDNVPLLLRPIYFTISWVLGIILYTWLAVHSISCRITFLNKAVLQDGKPYIYAFWHEDLPVYFMCHLRYREPYIWLNHPAWFMKPIHVCLQLMGAKLALGSSGNSGREALQKVVEGLKKEQNTVITPDGPYGPAKVLKKGVLEMSLQSGVEIVGIRFHLPRPYRYSFGWDRKRSPKLFSSVNIEYSQPMQVNNDNYQQIHLKLTAFLNETFKGAS